MPIDRAPKELAISIFAEYLPFPKNPNDHYAYDLIVDHTFSNQKPEIIREIEILKVDNTVFQINWNPFKKRLQKH